MYMMDAPSFALCVAFTGNKVQQQLNIAGAALSPKLYIRSISLRLCVGKRQIVRLGTTENFIVDRCPSAFSRWRFFILKAQCYQYKIGGMVTSYHCHKVSFAGPIHCYRVRHTVVSSVPVVEIGCLPFTYNYVELETIRILL